MSICVDRVFASNLRLRMYWALEQHTKRAELRRARLRILATWASTSDNGESAKNESVPRPRNHEMAKERRKIAAEQTEAVCIFESG